MRVTVVPETVQTEVLLDAKLTVKPEDAVALSAGTEPAPIVCVLRVPNVMVCVPVTVKVCVTDAAAA